MRRRKVAKASSLEREEQPITLQEIVDKNTEKKKELIRIWTCENPSRIIEELEIKSIKDPDLKFNKELIFEMNGVSGEKYANNVMAIRAHLHESGFHDPSNDNAFLCFP